MQCTITPKSAVFAAEPGVPSSRATLELDDVMELAKEENCELIHLATTTKPVSYQKYDISSNSYVRIDIWCDLSTTVGITLHHPRQVKMQVFCCNVSKPRMRQIFRSPRIHAGYSDTKRPNCRPEVKLEFAIGERVRVDGYGQLGIAKVTGLSGYLSLAGKMKIQFGDCREYRVNPDQITKVHLGPTSNSPHKGKSQPLKNEVKLQLKRLDREQERLQQERRGVLQLLQDITQKSEEKATEHWHNMGPTSSPSDVSRLGIELEENPMESASKNLEFTLMDSGAFANYAQIPHQPGPSSHRPEQPVQNRDGAMTILPPPDSSVYVDA